MKAISHSHRKVLIALCILSLTPALVNAGSTTKTKEEQGVIKSVDMTAHTVVVSEHMKNKKAVEQTFQWNDQTKFNERDKSANAGDLKQGERVHFTYSPSGSALMLQTVHIVPAKADQHADSSLYPSRNTYPARSKGKGM